MKIMDDEEKEAIQSLYSLRGESDINGDVITVNLSIRLRSSFNDSSDEPPTIPVRVILSVNTDYPESFPDISILSEHLNRGQTAEIKSKVIQRSQDLLGLPMVMSLLSLIEEYLQDELANALTNNKDTSMSPCFDDVAMKDCEIWTSVLHIDQMRSKNKYCKTLEKWASELRLCGRLFFCHRLILVLLQGELERIKDFVVRLKTTSIDVDSKGHSCKERMMTPLCEEKLPNIDTYRFKDFKRCELSSGKELEMEFTNSNLLSIYKTISANIRGYL